MNKLEIVDGSLQVLNNGSIILVAPKNLCAIDVLSLYDAIPLVVIYNKYLGTSTNIFTQPLANCENSVGTPFTVNSFIAFAEANLGFDTVNGGVVVNYGLFAQTTDSIPVTATAVESSLIGVGVGTLSVPANSFSIGDSFDATLDGVISAVGTATLEIRVKTLSGALLTDTGVINLDASTLKSWSLDLQFTIRKLGIAGVASISSGGLFSYIKNSGTNFEGFVLTTLNTTTFDTTIDNTLVVTAQWNTNNAGNSIFSRNFVLHKVY
jgi:hypothetical protein